MLQDMERVMVNAGQAGTEDLLDRVTVFREGMDPAALPILEQELRARGVTQQNIQAHAATRLQQRIVLSKGAPARCSCCQKPAVTTVRDWYRVWGFLPLFPRSFHYCAEHR
jgi:hypothetical protein